MGFFLLTFREPKQKGFLEVKPGRRATSEIFLWILLKIFLSYSVWILSWEQGSHAQGRLLHCTAVADKRQWGCSLGPRPPLSSSEWAGERMICWNLAARVDSLHMGRWEKVNFSKQIFSHFSCLMTQRRISITIATMITTIIIMTEFY